MMIGGRKFSGQICDDRFVLAGRKADVRYRRLPSALRVAHLERGRRELDRRLLRQRDVDAGIGRIDPAAQKEEAARAVRGFSKIQNQMVRLDDSLILRGREVGDVGVIAGAKRRQYVVATFVDCGDWQVALRDLE